MIESGEVTLCADPARALDQLAWLVALRPEAGELRIEAPRAWGFAPLASAEVLRLPGGGARVLLHGPGWGELDVELSEEDLPPRALDLPFEAWRAGWAVRPGGCLRLELHADGREAPAALGRVALACPGRGEVWIEPPFALAGGVSMARLQVERVIDREDWTVRLADERNDTLALLPLSPSA